MKVATNERVCNPIQSSRESHFDRGEVLIQLLAN